jgi:hypothetical protein
MRMTHALAIGIVMLATAATAEAGPVRMSIARRKVGDVQTVTQTSSMNMKITAKSKVIEVTRTLDRVETVEILAVDGNVITKEKISYSKRKVTSTGPGTKTEPDLAGKSFLVERTDKTKELTILTGDGGAPDEGDAAIVQKDARDVGKVEPLSAFISSTAFEIGKPVTLPTETVAALFEDTKLQATSATLTLDRVTGDKKAELTFDIALGGSQSATGITMSMPVKGHVVIDLTTGVAVSMDAAGPITVSGNVSGTGSFSVSGTESYTPAKK